MKRNVGLWRLVAFVVALGLVFGLASCGTPAPAPTPEVVVETVVVQQTVVVPPTPEPPKELIRVGMGEPFTGAHAWIGEDYHHGFIMAVEEINAEGGILGHPVEMFPCDNEGQPEKAITCVRKLVDQNDVHVIIGMGSSSCVLASLSMMEEYQVPFLAVATTNAAITENTGVGGNIWAFRMNPHDQMMAWAFADYLAAEADTFCMLAQNNDFGRGAVEQMKPLLEERDVEVLGEDYFEPGQPDYRPTITRWKSLNPDAVYLVMEASDASTFMRQYHELGMTAPVYTRGSVVTHEFLDAISDDPSLGEGIMEASLKYLGRDPDFAQRYLSRWGSMPTSHGTAAYYGLRYVVAAAAEMAIQESGEVTRSSIRDALENVSVETPIYGLIEFDEYNQAHPDVVIMQIQDGEVVLLEAISTD